MGRYYQGSTIDVNLGTNKIAGWSLIEIHVKVQKFVAGDKKA